MIAGNISITLNLLQILKFKMGARLRFAVGVMGDAASMLLYTAPMLTFSRVIRKKSTEGFSCVPYILALLNCFTYTWYGLPIVSNKWENFPLAAINGIGILLELSFILTYSWFAPTRAKKKIGIMMTALIVVCCMMVVVTGFTLKDHHNRKLFVGSIGLVASVAMYGSPLVVVKQVIETKSVEFMPFYLSFFSLVSSSLGMVYGLLGHDMFVAAPNFLGSPLGILQLVLYCKYKGGIEVEDEVHKLDTEKSITTFTDENVTNPDQQLKIVVPPHSS